MALRELASYRAFGGEVKEFEHDSTSTHCPMKFSVYLPPSVSRPLPVYYLAGLTCDHMRFAEKASTGLKTAAELGLALIMPDTSPRNLEFPEFKEKFTYGNAAGFYVDAVMPPFDQNFKMHTYVTQELPNLVNSSFPLDSRQGLMGHSMGGHGALVIGLTEAYPFKAVTALAPITNPVTGGWSGEAFTKYLGEDKETWKKYDALELVRSGVGKTRRIRIDIGSKDEYFDALKVPQFEAECRALGYDQISFHYHEGYSHGYYWVSTVAEDVLRDLHQQLVAS